MPDMTLLGVDLRTWITGGLIVLLVAVAHVCLRWWTRRRERRHADKPLEPGETPKARYWIARGLSDAVPPVAFLLWLHGLAFALLTLFNDYPDASWAQRGIAIATWWRGAGTLLGLAWLLARVARTLEALLLSFAQRTEAGWDDVLLPFAGRAGRLILPMIAIILGTPALAMSPEAKDVIQNGVSLLLVGTIAYVLIQFVNAMSKLLLGRYRLDVEDNRRARSVYTQVTVLRKMAITVIALFAIASMLMVFQSVRQLGTAMLASAGVAGIIVGFAAQKSLATLLAGLQIALTQPIRIDDVVIVEGEWGRIEEITLTYVVVNIWDWRRLVVPITYFIEQPFQNWTRKSSEVIGSIFLHVDYDVPIDAMREELTRILESTPLWDRKVNVLQVTDAKEGCVQLRALASASSAGRAWDLRCLVREKLVKFVQQNYPRSLPRLRAMIEDSREAATS